MPEANLKIRHRIYYAQTLAFLLIVIIAAAGIVYAERDRDALCRASYDNREAIRDLAREISNLGEDLVLGDPPKGDISQEQKEAIDRFEEFEQEQLDHRPLPVC
jgi:hypothetical protein